MTEKRGRKKKEPKVKRTCYFLESDIDIFDSKNRAKALKMAKEISENAVHAEAMNYQYFLKSSFDVNEFISKLIENEEERTES